MLGFVILIKQNAIIRLLCKTQTIMPLHNYYTKANPTKFYILNKAKGLRDISKSTFKRRTLKTQIHFP